MKNLELYLGIGLIIALAIGGMGWYMARTLDKELQRRDSGELWMDDDDDVWGEI